MTTHSIALPDTARKIAIDYWRNMPHCFQGGYPEKEICGRCDMFESSQVGLHLPVTAKTVATIVTVDPVRGYNKHPDQPTLTYLVTPSCGHEPVRRSRPDGRHKAPQVGDTFDCWTCEWTWQDHNFPGLPTEITEQIEALIPSCPECGARIKYLPFITFTKHDVSFEIDGAIGELNGWSEAYDTLDEQPEWTPTIVGQFDQLANGWQTGEIAVSCENNHEWKTRRLAWRHSGISAHNWRIIDAT